MKSFLPNLQINDTNVYFNSKEQFYFTQGFFGKGMLSRSRPQFEKYNDVLSDNAQRLYVGKYKGSMFII